MKVGHRTIPREINMTISLAKTSLRLVAGCSFAALIALGSGAAFAHGGGHNGGGHNGNGGQSRMHNGSGSHNGKGGRHASSHWDSHQGWHHKHRHHHKKSAGFGPGGLGPVHGPGSSHNPIVTKPPKVPKPVVAVGPAKPPPGTHYIHHIPCSRDHRQTTWGTPIPNVRDHRGYDGGTYRPYPPRGCSW